MTAKTLFDKIWESHMVYEEPGKPTLLYIDLHLVHEVTSPQAFEGLRLSGRRVRRPDLIFATMDHNVPTSDRSLPIEDPISAKQIETLRENFLQAEDGIRDDLVTGVQTCALPISLTQQSDLEARLRGPIAASRAEV